MRPRGYAPWNPKAETVELIDAVREVLTEYRAHLPLTVRQIFYRLVGSRDYEKTERAYSRLCEHLVRARRAEMIPFSSIRDDGTKSSGGDWGYSSPDDFWQEIRESADGYQRRTREGQPERVELWCEAAGMVPQLARVAQPFGVPVYSTGGFSSVTVTHEIAERARRGGLPTVFLHVGDYDPSGESIFDAMSDDARAFLYGASADAEFHAIRVALTEDQVIEHDLPTAPPKSSDSRSRNWAGDTCQAEAMPPDLLARIVTEELEEHFDQEIFDEVRERETSERAALVERLEKAMG
jgi:hypothetical protein